MFARFTLLLPFGCAILFTLPNAADAHKVFEKQLEKKYDGINASCNVCHVAKKEKTERNHFGDLFALEFKGKDFSKKWNEMERDEQKKFEKKEMIPAFIKAIDKIKEMKDKKTNEKFDDLIKNIKLDGLKPKKKKK